MNNRFVIPELVVLRALAILLILSSHIPDFLHWTARYLWIASFGGVHPGGFVGNGIFFFISGLLLKRGHEADINLFKFYRNRLIRIYPLYIIGVISYMAIFGGYSLKDFAIYATCLQMIVAPQEAISTYWFVGSILICYLIFPFMRGIYSSVMIFIFLAILTYFNFIQYYFIEYFPFFIFGIVAYNSEILKVKFSQYLLFMFIAFAGLLVITQFVSNKSVLILFSDCALLILLPLIYKGSTMIVPFFYKYLTFISNGAYATYLFHIPFLAVLSNLLLMLKIEEPYFSILILSGLPIMFWICFVSETTIEKHAKALTHVSSART